MANKSKSRDEKAPESAETSPTAAPPASEAKTPAAPQAGSKSVRGPAGVKLLRNFGVPEDAAARYPSAKNGLLRAGTVVMNPTDEERELVGAGFAEEVRL